MSTQVLKLKISPASTYDELITTCVDRTLFNFMDRGRDGLTASIPLIVKGMQSWILAHANKDGRKDNRAHIETADATLATAVTLIMDGFIHSGTPGLRNAMMSIHQMLFNEIIHGSVTQKVKPARPAKKSAVKKAGADAGLSKKVKLTPAQADAHAKALRGPLSRRVKGVVREQLGLEQDPAEEAAFVSDLGADSLDLVELVMGIEDEFRIEIPDEAAEGVSTVGQVIDLLMTKLYPTSKKSAKSTKAVVAAKISLKHCLTRCTCAPMIDRMTSHMDDQR